MNNSKLFNFPMSSSSHSSTHFIYASHLLLLSLTAATPSTTLSHRHHHDTGRCVGKRAPTNLSLALWCVWSYKGW